nr:uncharacterized protein LOC119167652 isoform X1 [Rhipicephalus microplus]
MSWLKLAIGMLFFGLATATPRRNVPPERVDTFRTIAAFQEVVAISTSTNDTSFKCLSAIRTEYDPEAKTATYVWRLRGQGGTERRNVTFTITAGTTSNQANYIVDADNTTVYTGYTHYTDFQNCLITTITYRDHDHCLLWVQRSVANDIPQNCLQNYEANCDVRVPIFEIDLCNNDEGHQS